MGFTPVEACRASTLAVPIVSNNVKEWEKKWGEQKITRDKAIYILGKDEIPPDNKVDTVEYWTELINSIE